MGQEATFLENEIRRERAELAESIDALERKVSRASNWRYQYAKRPGLMLGGAFVGGLVLARLVANGQSDPNWDEDAEDRHPESKAYSREPKKMSLLHGLQAVVLSAITHEVKDYLRNRFSSVGAADQPAGQRQPPPPASQA